jgi:hypothetical protein
MAVAGVDEAGVGVDMGMKGMILVAVNGAGMR